MAHGGVIYSSSLPRHVMAGVWIGGRAMIHGTVIDGTTGRSVTA